MLHAKADGGMMTRELNFGVKVILQYVEIMQQTWYGRVKRMSDDVDKSPHSLVAELETKCYQTSRSYTPWKRWIDNKVTKVERANLYLE